jgi:hypothetical protein
MRAQRAGSIAALAGISAVVIVAGTGAAAPAPTVGGCAVFPASSAGSKAKSAADQTAWNQDVSRAPVARNSNEVIAQINRDGGRFLHPDFGSNTDYGIPFEVVDPDQANVDVEIGPNGYPDESDFGPAPIPPNAKVEGGSNADGDRHVLVVQRGSCGLYELYRAFKQGNGWRADATAFFDLTRAGPLRKAGFTSADAAGLPILPGLVRYEEVAAGAVNHAIRVTFEETRRAYLKPATHYASDSCNRKRPPMGLRLRMKRSYYRSHLSQFPAGSQSRVIFEALRHYGFINADNGSNWFFQGGSDSRWDDDDLSRLKRIPGTAFQVVQSASKLTNGC